MNKRSIYSNIKAYNIKLVLLNTKMLLYVGKTETTKASITLNKNGVNN